MSLAVRSFLGLILVVLIQCSAVGQQSANLSTETPPLATIEYKSEVFNRYRQFCEWSADERRLLKDLVDSSLDQHTLFEASLIIAGHNQQQIAKYQRQLSESIGRCRSVVRPSDSQSSQLRAIFGHLSKEFLYGEYQAELYDVGRTLEHGDFNCLTATVLYQSLCNAFSIDLMALWEPSHVQCWSPISVAAGYIIETTASSPKNAVSPLTMTIRLENRRLSSCELVAKVFYNRGVEALSAEQYPEALICTWACCVLDSQDSPAQSNLRACINNWALAASQADDLQLARKLFNEGMKLDPAYEPFARNRSLLLDD